MIARRTTIQRKKKRVVLIRRRRHLSLTFLTYVLKSFQTVANTRRGMSRCVYPLFDSRKESSFTSSWRKISICVRNLISLLDDLNRRVRLLFLGGPQSSYVSLPLFFFLLRKRERERGREHTTELTTTTTTTTTTVLGQFTDRERQKCVCVHACVCKHALRLDDDFF